MTQEELISVFKCIVKKCDMLINNDNYEADAYTQDTVEDIAELCNHILDGGYGKLVEAKDADLNKEIDKEWDKCEPIDEGMGLEIASIEHGQFGNLAKHFFELGIKAQVQSVWHNYLDPIEMDKTILIVSPNGNSSLALWSGKELLSTTLGGGHSVLCKGDQWVYIEDLNKMQKGE